MILTPDKIKLLSSEIANDTVRNTLNCNNAINSNNAILRFSRMVGITHNAQLLAFSRDDIIEKWSGKSNNDPLHAGHVLLGIEDRFQQYGFKTGCLVKFQHRLIDELAVRLVQETGKNGEKASKEFSGQAIKAILEDIAVNHTVPDPVAKWLEDSLPEGLKKGVTPEFLRSVLNDKDIKQRVQTVLASEVRMRLDINT